MVFLIWRRTASYPLLNWCIFIKNWNWKFYAKQIERNFTLNRTVVKIIARREYLTFLKPKYLEENPKKYVELWILCHSPVAISLQHLEYCCGNWERCWILLKGGYFRYRLCESECVNRHGTMLHCFQNPMVIPSMYKYNYIEMCLSRLDRLNGHDGQDFIYRIWMTW